MTRYWRIFLTTLIAPALFFATFADAKDGDGDIFVRVSTRSGDDQPAGSFLARLRIYNDHIRLIPVLEKRAEETGRDRESVTIYFSDLRRTGFLNRSIVKLEVGDTAGLGQTWFLAPPAHFEVRKGAVSNENAVRILCHAILTSTLREIENRSAEMPLVEFVDRIDDAIRICDFDPNLPGCGRLFLFLKIWAERQARYSSTNPGDPRRGEVQEIANRLRGTLAGRDQHEPRLGYGFPKGRYFEKTRRAEADRALKNLTGVIANTFVPPSYSVSPEPLETTEVGPILQEAKRQMERDRRSLEEINSKIKEDSKNLEKLGALKDDVLKVVSSIPSGPPVAAGADSLGEKAPKSNFGYQESAEIEAYITLNRDVDDFANRPNTESMDLEELLEEAMKAINKSSER